MIHTRVRSRASRGVRQIRNSRPHSSRTDLRSRLSHHSLSRLGHTAAFQNPAHTQTSANSPGIRESPAHEPGHMQPDDHLTHTRIAQPVVPRWRSQAAPIRISPRILSRRSKVSERPSPCRHATTRLAKPATPRPCPRPPPHPAMSQQHPDPSVSLTRAIDHMPSIHTHFGTPPVHPHSLQHHHHGRIQHRIHRLHRRRRWHYGSAPN